MADKLTGKKTIGIVGYCMLILSLQAINVRTVEFILGERAVFGNGFISTKSLIVIVVIVTLIFWKAGLIDIDISPLKKLPKKREILISLGLAAAFMVILILFRQVIQAFHPEIASRPFFRWYFMYHTRWFYPVNVVMQEAFIRFVVQDNLKKLEDESTKYASLLLSGCFFAALHMAYPWYMMIGTAFYCIASGNFYGRYKCFWGLCILHFVGGFFPRCFGII